MKLELKELKTIRLNAEFVLALEACLLDIYRMLRPKPSDYEQRAVLVRAFNMLAKDTFGNTFDILLPLFFVKLCSLVLIFVCKIVEAIGSLL